MLSRIALLAQRTELRTSKAAMRVQFLHRVLDAESSNGRIPGSEPGDCGSSPCTAAKRAARLY